MLYIGEEVGNGDGPEVDIALDPLEGTTLTAKDMPNALTVIAMGPRGSMLHAPDVYMDKLAIGPGLRPGVVTLDMSPAERVSALASAKGCSTKDITVCILERPRHEEMIAELRTTGLRHPSDHRRRRGGRHALRRAPRRASTCTWARAARRRACWPPRALKCHGAGKIYGKLLFRNDDEKARAKNAGITNLNPRLHARRHGHEGRHLRRHRRHRRIDPARDQARARNISKPRRS